MKNLFKIWKQTHKWMPVATRKMSPCLKSALLAGYFVLELVLVVLSPSQTDEINIFNMWLPLSPFCLLCFAWFASKIMAQKRLSDFFSSVSKRTRNENEDKTVEQLKLNQKASKMRKTSKKLRKGNRLPATTLRKFRVEWKQLYPWLDYNNGKMFCLWCCEYGNLTNASFLCHWRMYLR